MRGSMAALFYTLGALTGECGRLLKNLTELPDDAPVTGADAYTILEAVARETDEVDLEDLDLPGIPADVLLEEFGGFTADLVRQGIAAIAALVDRDPTWLLYATLARTQTRAATKRSEAERAVADLDRLRRERLLPDTSTLDKVVRYEAHLNRQLYQALHELEALEVGRGWAAIVNRPWEAEVGPTNGRWLCGLPPAATPSVDNG